MKKLAAFLLALTMALSAAACGGTDDTSGDTVVENKASQSESADEPAEDEASEENDDDADDGEQNEDPQSEQTENTDTEEISPEEEQIRQSISAQIDAINNDDAEAFAKALNVSVLIELMYKGSGYEEYDDIDIDEIISETEAELVDSYFVAFKDMLGGADLSSEVKDFEIRRFDEMIDIEEDVDPSYSEALELYSAFCKLTFKLFDEVSGTDMSFNGTAICGDGKWCIIIEPGEESSMESYVKKSKLRTANSNAKTAYAAASEYIAENEIDGISIENSVSELGGEDIDCSDPNAYTGGKRAIAEWFEFADNAGYVTLFASDDVNYGFVVQWRESPDSEFIGQYPEPVNWEVFKNEPEKIIWGKFIKRD